MMIFRKTLLCTLIFMGFVFAQNEPAVQQSHLVFDEASFDFGVLTTDSLVTHVFNFKNTGPDTIEIHNVGSSWGCTAALLSSGVIAPGSSGEIKVTFDPKNKAGQITKTIRVYTSEENFPLQKLKVVAEIKREEDKRPSAPKLR